MFALFIIFGIFIISMSIAVIISFYKSKIGILIAIILFSSGGSMLGYGYYLVGAPDIKEGILIEKFRANSRYYFVLDNKIKLRQYSVNVDEYYRSLVGDEIKIDIN